MLDDWQIIGPAMHSWLDQGAELLSKVPETLGTCGDIVAGRACNLFEENNDRSGLSDAFGDRLLFLCRAVQHRADASHSASIWVV